MTDTNHDITRGGCHAESSSSRSDGLRLLDWDALRDRLTGPDEQPLWRGLDELSEDPEFFDYLHREFPRQASEWVDPASRRSFLKLMAASLGLAGVGLSGCMRQPDEKIVPYVRQPEDAIPGKPQYFATCMTLGGFATGLLVESHLGRPTKIEGNPDHPASLGATDVFAQATILSLYDPDRSQTTMKGGRVSTWGEFLTALTSQVQDLRGGQGRGLAILTETVTSPTLAEQLKSLRKDLPEARWYQYEPASRDNVRGGAKLAFGEFVDTVYHFDKADLILSLDAEFLAAMPGSLRYTRDFVDRRRLATVDTVDREKKPSSQSMNRLYAVESTPGLTGAQADHRLPMRAQDVEALARAVAARLGIAAGGRELSAPKGVPAKWLNSLVSDLQANRGTSLVIAGEGQPAVVHALVHAINRQLDNVGHTVEYVTSIEPEPMDQMASLSDLVQGMRQGDVKALFVLGGNPLYNAPQELEFAKAYDRVGFRVHLSPEYDETSFASHWHIPQAHSLEAWSDARAFDGTVSIQQPLIAPLYGGRTDHELIAALAGHPELTSYQIVQQFWKTRLGHEDFDRNWRRAVHDGTVLATRAETINPAWKFIDQVPPLDAGQRNASTDGLEISFCPDPTVWDGRFANNGWLQELPKPITKLTWDNAALVSPRTAERLGIANHELVELTRAGQTVRAPVWIVPGQPDDSISLAMGYGRTRTGRVGTGIGVNSSALRPARKEWFAGGVELKRTGARYRLAVTQNHHSMEGRDLIQVRTLEQFKHDPDFISTERSHPEQSPSLYPRADESEYGWGMVIDQTACIGCNACVVACQSENNIPIVGKEQVITGREMQWLRIDRYYRGGIDSPDTHFQPLMCVHCENAPCELVCPVAATVHSHEGLNQMVYNRCVGTRYCSNNCPYKVRRFNFLDYNREMEYDGAHAPSLELMRNPDVTVRSRGVMEKCTYCVQRINETKIDAQKQNRTVKDGEITTACQQACPARAITFGNIRDRQSAVSKLKESPLNYSLLAELNTLPRTTHLARIRNPHPDLDGPATNDTRPVDPTLLDRLEGQ